MGLVSNSGRGSCVINYTRNFWNIENEHLKNIIFFIVIIFVSLIAIISSNLIIGIVNILRYLITNPDLENLRNTATNLINTSDPWNLVNELLRGILIVYLIKIVHRTLNKSNISLGNLGFHLELKQLANLAMGIALMSCLFLVALFKNVGGQQVVNSMVTTYSQNGIVLLILIAIANAFWQEVVFRGYFQKRLMTSYGIITGIVLTSFLFTTIHGLSRGINLIEILLGTILFTLIGVVYYLTNSIIYVTAIHATANFYLRSFTTNGLYMPEQKYRLAVFSLALVIIVFLNRKILFPKNDQ